MEWDEEPECATDSTPGSRLTVSAEAPSVAQPKPLSRNTLRAGHGGQQTAGRKIEQHDSTLGISIQVTPGLIVGGMLRPSDSLQTFPLDRTTKFHASKATSLLHFSFT